jgi:cysteine synthase
MTPLSPPARHRAKQLGPGKNIVTVIIDTGLRYLNGDLFG